MERRVFVVVIDALGVGALPDAPDYQDSLSVNTLGNIDKAMDQLHLPNLETLGAGMIQPLKHVAAVSQPKGRYGRMAEHSAGKDTTTGHWEMMGLYLETPFPVFPEGFPPEVIDAFVAETECGGVLGNIPASGTTILEQLGEAHLQTGYPIVYTSADSVFQIAAHVDKVPLATLYHWCNVARRQLQGPFQVSRVIARPFEGPVGAFKRVGKDRRDYAIPPVSGSCLDVVQQAGGVTLGVGKIEDIFCQVGITHAIHTHGNTHGLSVTQSILDRTLALEPLAITQTPITQPDKQLVFVNLVDTDMNFGHRRDVAGYAHALEEIDVALGQMMASMGPNDLLMITGDHGCDPTAPGSDHTREYVPIWLYSPSVSGGPLGTRTSFADVGKTALDWLGLSAPAVPGVSMLQTEAVAS